MTTIIGIRFRNSGKTYYFDPGEYTLAKGDMAVVETARGPECGEVVLPNREVPDDTVVKPLKSVLRPATEEDRQRIVQNAEKEQNAMRVCQEKIRSHNLDMKLFYFTADGRVDFRGLVKDLASVFRTRIELRQIGVRDEAKMLGGLGICGRPFCCAQFLSDFQPVSIKMAKEQGLSLNPTKISGSCGRLMCCLKYEQNTYDELLRSTPRVGTLVQTDEGRGVVREVNLLAGKVAVLLDKSPDSPPVSFSVAEVRIVRDGKNRSEKSVAAEEPSETQPPRPSRPLRTRRADKADKPDKADQPADTAPSEPKND